MGTFRHTPDDVIYINATSFPLSFFLTLQPTYTLPAGETLRVYVQGSYHYTSNNLTQNAQPMPFAIGDTSITNEVAYALAYYNHLNPAPTLSQAKIDKINEMMDYASNIKNGHIIYVANEYFSDSSFLQKLINEDLTYTRAAALPVGYYINDVDYVQIAAAFVDLEAIIDRIVELYYLTDINIDVHRAAINALTTVLDVQAYDYITGGGWQTVPY